MHVVIVLRCVSFLKTNSLRDTIFLSYRIPVKIEILSNDVIHLLRVHNVAIHSRMAFGLCILLFIFCLGVKGQSLDREKRLILHSSDDVFQEIQNIRQQVQALKTENSNLKTSIDNMIQGESSKFPHAY